MNSQIRVVISLFTLGILVSAAKGKISEVEKTKMCKDVEGCDEVLKTIPQMEQNDLLGICEYLVNKTTAARLELSNVAASLANKSEDEVIKTICTHCIEHFGLGGLESEDEQIANDFKSGNFKGVQDRAQQAMRSAMVCVEYFDANEMAIDPSLQQKTDEARKVYVLIKNIAGELSLGVKGSGEKKHNNRKHKDSDSGKKDKKTNKHGGVDASAPSGSAPSPSPVS